MSKIQFVAVWIASSVAAVLIAVIIATVVFAQTLPVVLGVAAVEGVTLGVVQQILIRRTVPWLPSRWALATIAGAVLGRACEFTIDTSRHADSLSAWPPIVQVTAFAALGLGLGVIMGAPQALVLWRHVPGAWRWLAVRGAAWAFALVLLFGSANAIAHVSASAPIVAFAVIATVFASVAAIVGAIEGFGMAEILRLESKTLASVVARVAS